MENLKDLKYKLHLAGYLQLACPSGETAEEQFDRLYHLELQRLVDDNHAAYFNLQCCLQTQTIATIRIELRKWQDRITASVKTITVTAEQRTVIELLVMTDRIDNTSKLLRRVDRINSNRNVKRVRFFSCMLFLVSINLCLNSQAQFFKSFFSQNKEYKQNTIKQIALINTHLASVKKGISLCRNGLSLVHDIKNGEFGLHTAFFQSMQQVNPKIRNASMVSSIMENCGSVLAICMRTRSVILKNPFPKTTGDQYLQGNQELLNAITDTLDDLELLITNNRLNLSDDERLARLEILHRQSIRHNMASQSIYQSVTRSIYNYHADEAEIRLLKQLHN